VKYQSLIAALILGLAGTASATQYDPAESESDTDDRVACIEAAIAGEVEDGNQFNQYVDACFRDGKNGVRADLQIKSAEVYSGFFQASHI
jgi:hypothetical protein